MKGEEHLWGVLNDKLDTLRATNHMAEAIRVGQSALEIAKRSFGAGDIRLALSYMNRTATSLERRLIWSMLTGCSPGDNPPIMRLFFARPGDWDSSAMSLVILKKQSTFMSRRWQRLPNCPNSRFPISARC